MQQWLFDLRSRKFILVLVFFLTLTSLADTKIIFSLDNGLETYVHSLEHNIAVGFAMQIFTEIGWVPYSILVSFILLIKKKTRRLGLILLLSVIVGSMLSAYLRCYIGYGVPVLKFEGAHLSLPLAADVGVPCVIGRNFPSDHTVVTTIFAFVLGFALSKRFPRGCYLLWIYPVLVSISRLYLMQQFMIDLVGGALLGLLVANIVSRVLKLELIFENQKPNS